MAKEKYLSNKFTKLSTSGQDVSFDELPARIELAGNYFI